MATPPPIPLDYLVVLDLEAYCDNPADPHGPEIVEFPFLVYDLATHTVVDHKQIYVAPRWSTNPNPPPDVVHAFGIDVAFAPSLSDAIAQFDTYIYQSFFAAQKTFYLITDGHWDITRYLYFEAARKAVLLNAYFRVFFDLRTEFRKCYPTAPVPHDRQAMFDYLRVPPPTRGGSGIDECIGLAALVTRLLRDGHRFTQPEFIAEAEWSALNARVPVVATSVAAAQPVGAVIRLRGLPWASSKHDVEKFLAGIRIVPEGIHFVRNVYGKVTGEAFVQLATADGVAAALARHKRSVGRRYIEVFKSSPVDMANHLGRADAKRHLYAGGASVSSQRQRSSGGGRGGHRGGAGNTGNSGGNPRMNANSKDPSNRFVVKVTGLPGDASADDVALLMEGVQITGEGVHLVIRSDGLCIGDAYVEVASEVHVKKALSRAGTSLPIARVGYGDAARYVTVDVRKSSMAQLRAVIYEGQLGKNGGPSTTGVERGRRGPSNNGNSSLSGKIMNASDNASKNGTKNNGNGTGGKGGKGGEGGGDPNASKFSVTVRNLPESAGVTDVIELMQGVQVTEGDVKMEAEKEGSDGKGGSERGKTARVTVRSREERDRALELTGRALRGQEVSVVADPKGNGGGTASSGRGSRVVRMRGLPFSAGDEDIIRFFSGFRIVEDGIVRGRDRHGRASGEASVTFATEEEAWEAVRELDKKHMGNRYIELRF